MPKMNRLPGLFWCFALCEWTLFTLFCVLRPWFGVFISTTKSNGIASIVATGCTTFLRVVTIFRVGSLEFNCIVLNCASSFFDDAMLAKQINLIKSHRKFYKI